MKKERPMPLGAVVRSIAGRDGGRLFIVVGLPDDEFALIADGDLRKVEKPKRKKRKHLKVIYQPIAELAQRLPGGKVENFQIRNALISLEPREEE